MHAARIWFAAAILVGGGASPAMAQQAQPANSMSFFVSSVGPGKGGNLGGLLGADRHCQMLATAAGAGNKTWHAYLSENGSAGHPTITAKDRIGSGPADNANGASSAKYRTGRGPWYNATGVLIANNVADLHSDKNNINKMTALTEKGDALPG